VHDVSPSEPAPVAASGAPPPATARSALIEVIVLFLISCGLIRGVLFAKDSLGLSDNWYIVPAILFIVLPDLRGWLRNDPVDPDVVLPKPLAPAMWRATRWLALLVLLIYPAFILGNHLWNSWLLPELSGWFLQRFPELGRQFGLPFAPHFPSWTLPTDLHWLILWHLLPVGYAEEFFYRGWMQTHLDRSMGTRWRVLGADLGPGFLWTAVLFTLGHTLVEPQWWQPFIFFPALIFGWLRARTGTILAGTLFHAFANVAMIVLDTMYGLRAP
jgi:membrane protease YdiL (CAAX protease family)